MSDREDSPPALLTRATAGLFSTWAGWAWMVGLSGLGCLIAIMLGFFAAQQYAGGLVESISTSESQVTDGRMLRSYANQLNVLAADLANYGDIVLHGDPPEGWVENDFRPRLNDYRRRLSANAHRHPAMTDLLAAADTLANYAAQPTSESYRQQMRTRVLQAVGTAEAAIGEMGVAQYINEPTFLPGF